MNACSYYLFLKRGLDIIFSIISLFLFSPVFLIFFILVRVKLGSPVIFSQRRPGLNGKLFTLFKFRSMAVRYNQAGDLLPDAQRLTPLGNFMRLSSIDELPSLINILKGDMSFVGPRPFAIELDQYHKKFLNRFRVLPGLTGWAQVNGRNSITWNQKFQFDCWYVSHVSFLLDFYILIKTFIIVFNYKIVNSMGHATSPVFRRD